MALRSSVSFYQQYRFVFHPDARVPGQPYRMLDFGGAIAIAAMLVMAVVAAIAHTRQLYLQETI